LERYYMLSVKLYCSYSELGHLNALMNHRMLLTYNKAADDLSWECSFDHVL